jgi:hypothetical protein
MVVIDAEELDELVRTTFPQKQRFSAGTELGLAARRPVFASVHGGYDPMLERHFEAWLAGAAPFVAPYQLLNRLCREGVLKPGEYALRQRR